MQTALSVPSAVHQDDPATTETPVPRRVSPWKRMRKEKDSKSKLEADASPVVNQNNASNDQSQMTVGLATARTSETKLSEIVPVKAEELDVKT